jgi:DNA repair protein SbcD/Mre11
MARILHTADWHLGARLADQSRLEEHARFLDWMVDVIRQENVDHLLVAGDIFDSAHPPTEAVQLYYDTLARLAALGTVSVIITGGNHDSASHLNAPQQLLRAFRIHVVGSLPAVPADAIFTLPTGVTIAAIPFLRERDLRLASAGETWHSVAAQVQGGIARVYAEALAQAQVQSGGGPILAMGHLFAQKGDVRPESERDIHVGNLGAVPGSIFAGWDYVALGHLHRPQQVGGAEGLPHCRYSGSPVALSFSEWQDEKQVIVIEAAPSQPLSWQALAVPCARPLLRLQGTPEEVRMALMQRPVDSGLAAYADVSLHLTAPDPQADVIVRETAALRGVGVLKIAVRPFIRPKESPATATDEALVESLDTLHPRDVFRRKLVAVPMDPDGPEGQALRATFDTLLSEHEARRLA